VYQGNTEAANSDLGSLLPAGSPAKAASAANPPQEALPDAPFLAQNVHFKQKTPAF